MPLPQNVPNQNAPAPTPPPQPAVVVDVEAVDDSNQAQNNAEVAAGGGIQGAVQNEHELASKEADALAIMNAVSAENGAALSTNSNFTVGQIQNLIWLEMDKVLKKRLPSLGTEIKLHVDQAVGHAMAVTVPELVGDILIEAANRYAEDENVTNF